MEGVDEWFDFTVGVESDDDGAAVFATEHFCASAESAQ